MEEISAFLTETKPPTFHSVRVARISCGGFDESPTYQRRSRAQRFLKNVTYAASLLPHHTTAHDLAARKHDRQFFAALGALKAFDAYATCR